MYSADGYNEIKRCSGITQSIHSEGMAHIVESSVLTGRVSFELSVSQGCFGSSQAGNLTLTSFCSLLIF